MNRSRTRLRTVAGIFALCGLTAACGLKADATASLRAEGTAGVGAAVNPATGSGGPGGAGSVPGAPGSGGGPGVPGAPGGTGSGTTVAQGGNVSGPGATGPGVMSNGTGNGSGNGTGTGSGPGTSGSSGPCSVPSGGDTTGISANYINIGLHAPLTGTGTPFPNSSFVNGASTFWKQPGHTVCGRKVQVEFQDDQYTPAHARQVCTQMAQRDFFVVGGGGTDQIQACATGVAPMGTPYLSAGVTDNGMQTLQNYFAVSLTYQQQGVLVLRNARDQKLPQNPSSVDSDNMPGHPAVWAIVTGDSKNFDGARLGMEDALSKAQIPWKEFKQNQNGNYQSAATDFGRTLAQDGFTTIFVDMAPGYFVFMSGGYYAANTINMPNWVGPGVTYTEVTVAQYICSSSKSLISGHAWFLAPGPGVDRATQDFTTAYNGRYDDIEWALWGLSKVLWQLLKNASDDLTRQNFIATSEKSIVPASGVYAPVDYRDHGGHFGGTGAWVQRVNCTKHDTDQSQPGYWDTIGQTYLSIY